MWIKNTKGAPDSQLTLQVSWNVLAMLVVVLVVVLGTYRGTAIPDMAWFTMMAAAGVNGATYVTRRRHGQPSSPPPDEDMVG